MIQSNGSNLNGQLNEQLTGAQAQATPTPMHIIKLEAENVRRLEAISIEPGDDPLVVIGGQNGAGKSSVLDAIWWALAGKGVMPRQPLREGTARGFSRLHIGDLVIERTINQRGTSLEVRKDGYLAPSPQEMLNELVGALAFDPLAFARSKAKDQLALLRELVGLDTTQLDQERGQEYTARTDVGRQIKQLEGELAALKATDTPTEEQSLDDLLNKLMEQERENRENAKQRDSLRTQTAQLEAKRTKFRNNEQAIAELEQRLATIKQANAALTREISVDLESLSEREREVDLLEDHDLSLVRQEISRSEGVNKQVREAARYRELQRTILAKMHTQSAHTERIKEIDEQKAERLAQIDFPVEGLSLDEEGVLYNGLPFEQASSAEQLRVSAEIGFALNPTLRVMLVRDGSLLDDRSMELLRELAVRHNAQVWIEMVGTGQQVSIVIEEGRVAEVRHRDHTTPTNDGAENDTQGAVEEATI
jgi:L-lactate utilization protein LutC